MNLLKKYRNIIVCEKDFYRTVITLVIPMIIQSTVTNLVNLLDNLMIGSVGTLQMSAVAIVNQLLFVYNLCLFGALSAVSIFCTQYAGAHDTRGVRHCFRAKWIIVICMSVVCCAVLVIWPNSLIGLFLKGEGSAEEAAQTVVFAERYMWLMLLGIIPFAVAQIYASHLRELKETRVPMFASVAAIVVNLLFNYLLIFGKFGFPQWGVAGAAIATVLSRVVELLIVIIYTHRQKIAFPFIKGAYRSTHVPGVLWRRIFYKGLPLLVNELFWSTGIATMTYLYSLRGLHIIAAVTITTTVANLFYCVFYSMGGAVAVMIGHELGNGQLNHAKLTAWRLMLLSFFVAVAMAVLLCAVAPYVPHLYNTEEEIRHLATKLICIGASAISFRSIVHAAYFTLRAGGKTLLATVLDSVFTWSVIVGVTSVVVYFTPLNICWVYLISNWMNLPQCALAIYLVSLGTWAQNIVKKE